ncbi:MAG: glycosyltransferase family 9 protein [Verrucomicrobia bacterium]|nr:glycosyltransferase family 9 protein [Verrucomicrobiota bacterium]
MFERTAGIFLKLESLQSRHFSRILLIKPSALGDVVHTVPLLPKLRTRYPDARIDWFITPENAELVRHHPALSGVVLFDRKKLARFGRGWDATLESFRLLAGLRRARYELVIDLHGQMRSALFTLATGAPVRIGFDRPVSREPTESEHHELRNVPQRGWAGAREGSWVAYSHRIPIETLDVHAIERYLWLGPMLGLDDAPPDERIYLSPAAEADAERLLGGLVRQRFAALAPGTMWETKHWLPERFAEVGQWFEGQGVAVVVLGTNQDRERAKVIVERCPGAVDLCGRTTPGQLAAIVKRAAACVTNDSGAMHLAVALETPVVGVFGPTNPVHIGPYGQPEAVVRAGLPCSPCNFRNLSQCPFGHACMHQVSGAMVIERLESALREKMPPGVECRASSVACRSHGGHSDRAGTT